MKKYIVNSEKLTDIINAFQVETIGGTFPINTNKRYPELLIARSIVYNFLNYGGYPLEYCGRFFDGNSIRNKGKKDHATVINSLNRYNQMTKYPKQFPEFEYIKKQLEPLLKTCIDKEAETNNEESITGLSNTEMLVYKAETYGDFLKAKSFLLQSLSA